MRILSSKNENVSYKVHRFPDGEVQIELDDIDRKDSYIVICRITNAEELFLFDQLMDILDRQEVVYRVCITYLMGMRMDRVIAFNRPFTLKVVADVINKHHAGEITVIEPHSHRCIDLIENCHGLNVSESVIPDLIKNYSFQIVLPDHGAKERYNVNGAIQGIKVRDLETGKITSIDVENPEDIKSDKLLIVDDLCDGGGTFCGLYNKLKEINPNLHISLYVTHMVNAEGLKKVCDIFDHIYTTNSYKDWDNSDKLTVFKI